MTIRFSKTLFIFRRDLRLEDNTGLIFALKNSATVIPCFIFSPTQIMPHPYRSVRCLQFMIESLEDLEEQLKAKQAKLYRFFDEPEKVVEECIEKYAVDAVVFNRDYTPYSLERDQKIAAVCSKHEVALHVFDDALLFPPEACRKSDGNPYVVFTPFFRNASRVPVDMPLANALHNYCRDSIGAAQGEELYRTLLPERRTQVKGGRKCALEILDSLKNMGDYSHLRNFPAIQGTTHLSAHLKFTTCSPREVYYSIVKQCGAHADLIRSLYWRDFFTHIAFFFPFVFKGAFHEKYNSLPWSRDVQAFERWCQGCTGFPIVDAGMRELLATGYMHNRVRMLVASFLVKDLHIDWRWGEKFFAQNLIDYDPALNNGNWQWSASTGCDAQPYFRIFNPWTQQAKFDPDCIYIKQWIPELALLNNRSILHWDSEKLSEVGFTYSRPMVNHTKESKVALHMYRSISVFF